MESDYTDPMQEVVNKIRPPTMFGQVEPLPDKWQEVITLYPAKGGLGIPSLREEAPQQYAASKAITAPHVRSIIEQSMSSPELPEDLKKQRQSLKAASLRFKIVRMDDDYHLTYNHL